MLLCSSACARGGAERTPTTVEQRYDAEPDDARANYELGRQAEAGADFLRAEQYYRRAEVVAHDEHLKRQIRHRLVATLVEARRYEEARARCQMLLDETPDDRPARFLLAAILESLDHAHEAERELQSLQQAQPEDPAVYLALAKLYRDSLGNRPRAILMFERFLELAPGDKEARGVRFELERQRLEEGEPAEAAPASASTATSPSPSPSPATSTTTTTTTTTPVPAMSPSPPLDKKGHP